MQFLTTRVGTLKGNALKRKKKKNGYERSDMPVSEVFSYVAITGDHSK